MSESTTESTEQTENEQPEEVEEQEQEQAESQEEDANDAPDDDFDRDRAIEKIRKLNSEARNERTKRKAAEEKAKQAEGKDERLTALEAENLRLRVGVKHGLPEALVKRLSGSTEEEMLQDAEELMDLLGPKAPPTNAPRENNAPSNRQPFQADELADPAKFAEQIYNQ